MPDPQNTASEADGFEISDILVSRTDERGVILAANKDFERVSGYPWERLQNAPHKLIRHPEMPKAVFWLIWDTLQAGNPIGAFVKNRCEDGSYYWVFAFVAPQGDGYLSVRIKPTAKVLDLISAEYNALLLQERASALAPAESAARLLDRLQELGFKDYGHFMADMATDQSLARADALGQPRDPLTENFAALTVRWRGIGAQCADVFDAHQAIAHTPANLRVQAAHLEDRGIPLSVIASNFTTLAAEITQMMTVFITRANDVEALLNEAAFLVALEHLMGEVVDVFQFEDGDRPGLDKQTEIAAMILQRQACFDKTVKQLREARNAIASFVEIIEETTRVLSGLSVAKIMCEIENAYVGDDSNSGVKATIAELGAFQKTARDKLYQVRKQLYQVDRIIKRVQSQIAVATAA